MPTLTAQVTEDFVHQLDELSIMLDRSRAWLIKDAIKKYLQHYQEDIKRWKETKSALDAAQNGEVISEKDMNDWLDDWGKTSDKRKK